MNYSFHYERLVARAKHRVLNGYAERHHVIPRCMGGGDELENIVLLFAEEHYVAHQLLVKIHPEVRGLALAAFRMAKQCTCNKAYGWLRRRMAIANGSFKRGKIVPAKTREKLSAALRRRWQTPDGREKMSAASRGRQRSAETRAKNAASLLGRKHSLETRAKMSAARLGTKRSPEVCAKISASLIGNKRALRMGAE